MLQGTDRKCRRSDPVRADRGEPTGASGALPSAVYLLVADQAALFPDATPPGTYRQRGVSSLQRLFRAHIPQIRTRYEVEFARRLGKFRLERITRAAERFLGPRDRGRSSALGCAAPPSEPDWRISRIRLSSQRLPPSGLTEGRMGFGYREKPMCRKERVRPALMVDASLPPVSAASSTQDSA